MPIVRWDPFRDLVQMRDEIGRWFGDEAQKDRDERSSAIWAPNVDIQETEKSIVIKADLPGMKEDDIEVSVDEGQLVIKGERKFEKEEKEKDYVRIERSYGSFYRSFNIGVPIKEDDVKASYKDGVLHVAVPKAEVKKPKKITVQKAKDVK